jgi:glutathione S-transferase
MIADDRALILHQYDASPFSEKVRAIFAHKRLPWFAVEQPNMMPKPDLVPLTGGYRRIPVLQIGADVYCDTAAIVRLLERLHPSPTLHPGGSEATCHAWNLWADRVLFFPVVAVVFAEIGAYVPQAFIEDRSRMMPGRDFADVPKQAPHAREQLHALVSTLEAQLADGRPFLLGAAFSLADAACRHPLWFLRAAPTSVRMLDRFPAVTAWLARVEAMGQGERSDLAPADALAIARAATPTGGGTVDPADPSGLAAGDPVAIVPDDYGFDPVRGTLVAASATELAVARADPALGELVVHFPRVGFRVSRT